MATTSEAFEAFKKLHHSDQLLILPNAWDVGSALLFEELGAPAIATTSAGVAWALGYADGNKLELSKLVALVKGLVASVRVPLTVDFEGGFSQDPATVGENSKRLLAEGIAGLNIEDSTEPFEALLRKIAAIRQAADSQGISVFINARTDVYLQSLTAAEQRVEETIRRAAAIKEHGADGLFVPALAAPEEIAAIAAEISLPLNVMAWPGLPAAEELTRLGVKRLSAGAAIPTIILKQAAVLAADFLKTGDSTPLMAEGLTSTYLQGLSKFR